MATYKVIKTIRKRIEPNFYADYDPNDPDAIEGEEFVSQASVADTNLPVSSTRDVIWEMLPDGKWVPRNHYKADYVYLLNISDPPIPTEEILATIEIVNVDGQLKFRVNNEFFPL